MAYGQGIVGPVAMGFLWGPSGQGLAARAHPAAPDRGRAAPAMDFGYMEMVRGWTRMWAHGWSRLTEPMAAQGRAVGSWKVALLQHH